MNLQIMMHAGAAVQTMAATLHRLFPNQGLILVLMALVALLFRQTLTLRRKTRENEVIRNRYARTIDASLDAVVVMNPAGEIVDLNRAGEQVFGLSRNAAIGMMMADLMMPEKHRAAHADGLARYLAGGDPRVVNKGRVRLEAVRADNELFPIELSIGTMDTEQGPLFIGYIRDISDQVQVQEELMEARDEALAAARAKSQFLAVMSHEMRTPLNGVLAVLDILLSTKLDPRQRHFVEVGVNSGELLQRHIDDVLQINELDNRKPNIHRVTFNVHDLIREIITMNTALAEKNGNTFYFDSALKAVNINEDRHRLSQILLNLVGNAVKFTQNGRIQIELERVEGPKGEDLMEIVVGDTGAGIAEEDLERIFDTFVSLDPEYRRTSRGYGLGLAISRRIVRAMGGEIGVESKKGVYSRFWVRLPYREATLVPRSVSADPDLFALPPPPVGLQVLLVEDNDTNRLVAHEMLQRFGCKVEEAVDGLEAVSKGERTRFDLILMDVNMPNLGGLEATKRIRGSSASASRQSPIIGLTAHALPEEQEALREAGMQDCIIKPLRARNLQQLLRRMTDFPSEFAASRQNSDAAEAQRHGVADSYLDEDILDELKSVLPAGAFETRLAAFGAEITTLGADLKRAWSGSDMTSLAARAHKSAGSSAIFGATLLRDELTAIEAAVKADNRDSLPGLIAAANVLAAKTSAALKVAESA